MFAVLTRLSAIAPAVVFDGVHVACTQATGQLRQQYVEPRHLAKQYTCIAWHRSASKVDTAFLRERRRQDCS